MDVRQRWSRAPATTVISLTERPLSCSGLSPFVASARMPASTLEIDGQGSPAILFLRSEHDPLDQAADDLGGFDAMVLIVQSLDQSRNLLTVDLR
jgi:hypothetical protein